MFNLSENDIHLSANASDKMQAIELAAKALEQAGYVDSGYLQGMLEREQQTSTYLGNGIAIPHGTLDTRHLVKKTGVQIFQFPQGITWGEGNTAYIVIGIAARSDEHLALLRQLTHILSDEATAEKLASLQDVAQFRALLVGQSEALEVQAETISLEVETDSLLTLTAINAGKLEQQQAVNTQFVADVLAQPALPLVEGIWLTDSPLGNQKNAIAFSRAKTAFYHNSKKIQGVLTIAAIDDHINPTLSRLLEPQVQQALQQGDVNQILCALNGKVATSAQTEETQSAVENQPVSEHHMAKGAVIGTFTLRNEHGLHARPSAVLVNEAKKFNANITVSNLTRQTDSVNAKSLMKLVTLGVTQGHRLRFVAEGEDALDAIKSIGNAIAQGLGESIPAQPPEEEDCIEVSTDSNNHTMKITSGIAENSVEAVFVIQNEHGLHARPAAVLVNEVKKYNASVAVQNLDRQSQLISAKSLMKVVALGVTKGHRLRFVATGEQAQQAIDGIGAVIAAGLGE
ncbi:fused PTS fructose transporter subunit IIA/HPr protein [Pasteurella sp. PK-2025]|uniref:fused PTS fructose transporter subunit IIA/HPr protein n=1 Tax=unclassified Pasteurella TaxID=2621516 RepID=UPI003C707EC5